MSRASGTRHLRILCYAISWIFRLLGGGVLVHLAHQFVHDVHSSSFLSAVCRAAFTVSFAVYEWRLFRDVLRQPAYAAHAAVLVPADRFGFAAHRSYLASGLSLRARGLAALQHYQHESRALDASYQESVYRRGGLTLWRDVHDGVSFEVRLLPGQHDMKEGGLSLTFFVDDDPVSVLSYSNLDPALLLGEPPSTLAPGTLAPFVGRRQGTRSPGREAFTRAFGRGTPGHFCIAALEGIALAQGCDRLYGVAARHHPSYRDALRRGRAGLEDMYDDFWRLLSGKPAGSLAWEMPVPLQPTPLEQLEKDSRRRAKRLRAHQAVVRDSAFRVFRSHLVAPPRIEVTPPPYADGDGSGMTDAACTAG